MMLTRRSVTVGSAAVATSALVLGPEALAAPRRRRKTSAEGGQVVFDWERICFRTVYTDALTPPPIGVPILGFVSLAMHRAAERSAHVGTSSESAAVARAAHDVLVHYLPAFTAKLDGDLATTFAAIGASHERTKGNRIGADAARDLLASRVGDGWMDSSIHYTKTPGPGVWWPNPPATDMVGAWLGSLRPLFVAPETQPGPYPLASPAWAADYEEVRRVGSTTSETDGNRTAYQTGTALLLGSVVPAVMLADALIRYLEAHPVGILSSARLFALVHGAMTDSVICAWKEKRDAGFWRPFQAISGLFDDGNPGTTPQPGWAPLIANPNYSDYLSGHGALMAPGVQVLRRNLGENTALELRSPTLGARTYATLSEIEFESFHARIWGGLHYRKCMTDTYEMGHRTAERVMAAFGA